MIWDVHAHLGGVEGRTPDERMPALVRFMDRMGVARVCLMMGYPFLTDPSAAQLRQQNDQVLQALTHFAETSGSDPFVGRASKTRPTLQDRS
jgi:uncharacterized protein